MICQIKIELKNKHFEIYVYRLVETVLKNF